MFSSFEMHFIRFRTRLKAIYHDGSSSKYIFNVHFFLKIYIPDKFNLPFIRWIHQIVKKERDNTFHHMTVLPTS
jgi:hypothetical protein